MTVVGAFTMVWHETRYLGPVLEQLKAVPGPRLLIVNEQPYFWLGSEPKPEPPPELDAIITAFRNDVEVVRLPGPADTENVLRNVATARLRAMGAETILWLDTDFLFEMDVWMSLLRDCVAAPPSCRTVNARHFWRTWGTTYSRGNFRIGYPATAEWKDGGFGDVENFARHSDVLCYHPSYVLNDFEVRRKLNSWFHAPLAREADWWGKWQSGAWDREQELEPADVKLPEELYHRLERWGSLAL